MEWSLPQKWQQRLARWARPYHERSGSGFVGTLRVPRQVDLARKYRIEDLESRLSPQTLLWSLGILDVLDRVPAEEVLPGMQSQPRIAEIGCASWRGLPALRAWLRYLSPHASFSVSGYELDGHRFHADGTTPETRSQFFARAARMSDGDHFEYLAGDATQNLQGQFGLIVWMLPFVFEEVHRAWGLSENSFRPQNLFEAVVRSVGPRGSLVTLNQTESELEETRRLMGRVDARFSAVRSERVEGSLHPNPYPLHLTVWRRSES